MSYILDALQRSQKERELGEVPTLGAAHYTEFAHPRARRPGPWVLTAIALGIVAMALALYTVISQQPASIVPSGSAIVRAQTPVPVRTPVTPAQASVTPDQAPRSVPTPIQSIGPEIVSTPEPTTASEDPANEPPPVMASTSAPDPVTNIHPLPNESTLPPDLLGDIQAFKERIKRGEPVTSGEVAPMTPYAEPGSAPLPTTPKPMIDSSQASLAIPGFQALPTQVQESIPAYRVSVHVYSEEPANRFVILNSRRMGEGETNRDGLQVESIQPRGVILRYGENHFFSAR